MDGYGDATGEGSSTTSEGWSFPAASVNDVVDPHRAQTLDPRPPASPMVPRVRLGQHLGMATARRLGLARAVLAVAAAGLVAGCTEVPPPEGRDAGRRSRVDGGPEPDGFVPRPPEPVLPPVDVEITLPWGAEARVSLEVGSAVSDLDLVLSVDTTGSFSGEIDALQSSFVGTIIPALSRRADRLAFAVTHFEDFPFGSFGDADDLPFELLTPLTTDLTRVAGGIARLDMPLGSGGDLGESGYEALYQIATGEGLAYGEEVLVPPWSASRMGSGGGVEPGVGLRTGSLRAVLHVTDAPSHDARDYGPPAHDRGQTIAALRAARLRVIGIASGAEARSHLEEIAIATDATLPPEGGVCRTGLRGASRPPVGEVCPLVFDLAEDGTGLSDVIVQAIADLLRSLSYAEVYGEARDDRLGFVHAIEAVSARVEAGGVAPSRTDERPADGILDTFRDVERGVTMSFEALLVNDVLPPADYEQHITFAIDILGDGVVIATRTVRVTVPRGRLPAPDASIDAAPVPDAGALLDASSLDAGSLDAFVLDAGPDAGAFDAATIEDAPAADAATGPDDAHPDDAHPDDAHADDAAS
jgi:hypothetical protein